MRTELAAACEFTQVTLGHVVVTTTMSGRPAGVSMLS